ncbi:MAG: hypothetical protein F4227_03925 [Gammaproteobacteria bacterium]|nr:hypothetical protein [Gammaproteobacteria bacterium]MYF02131.1 hypothetical protein [Gammaproteobacteria bacterium]MYI76777.1 hypothetical protein [Gammaproteobacteria bacterium]
MSFSLRGAGEPDPVVVLAIALLLLAPTARVGLLMGLRHDLALILPHVQVHRAAARIAHLDGLVLSAAVPIASWHEFRLSQPFGGVYVIIQIL